MNASHRIVLVALALGYALGPLATQMLTPAVPFVHRDLAIPMPVAQMLISLSFVAISAATVIYGPLADRVGRRPVLLAGTALFCAGSLVAALAATPDVMIAGRIVQAAGSAAGIVLTRTIVHDLYGAERSGQVIAYLTAVMIVAPMLAPVAGGLLLDHVHWRALFVLCLLAGLTALLLLALYLPETRRTQGEIDQRNPLHDIAALLRDPGYLASTLYFSSVMATFYAGQAALPFLFVEALGATATDYGLWFAGACLAFIAGNYATGRWSQRFRRDTMILLSSAGCLLTSIAGLVAANLLPWNQAVLFTPTVVLSFFGAVGAALVQAQALAAQPQRSGAASGLLSAAQMAIGAAVVQLIGLHQDGTPYPMFVVFISCATCALLAASRAWLARQSSNVGSFSESRGAS